MKDKLFTMKGRVAHSAQDASSGLFRTGICFSNASQLFKVKMAEQLYQIKEYRKALIDREGHDVSEEEAAQKWVSEHSSDFETFYRS